MLDNIPVIAAAVTFVLILIGFADLLIGSLAIPKLADQPVATTLTPRVSVVVAARDEQEQIEQALRSLLAQSYPDLELIVVDDRSADATGSILDRLAEGEPRLRVVHVTELPEGWLGKNHALEQGARMATGELLLFTDADVVFHPTAISRAVHYLTTKPVDHLAAGPDIDIPTAPLALLVHFFMVAFLLYLRPWKASDPKSRYFIGVGAFNLVRASTYRDAGTHARIRMRPDDDIMLGKILKLSGARQQIIAGWHMISVRWYASLREMIAGLQKNSFAGLDYSVPKLVGAVVGNVVLNIVPFIAPFFVTGATRLLYVGSAVLLMIMFAGGAAQTRNRPWLAVFYPVAAAIFIYVIVKASVTTLLDGGIKWRGTRYSLDELRANRI